jgi:hypothetical protein
MYLDLVMSCQRCKETSCSRPLHHLRCLDRLLVSLLHRRRPHPSLRMPPLRQVDRFLGRQHRLKVAHDWQSRKLHEAILDTHAHMLILILVWTEQSVLVLARELEKSMLDLAKFRYHPVTCFCCQRSERVLHTKEEKRVYLCLSDETCRFVGCISSTSGTDEAWNGISYAVLPSMYDTGHS